MQTYRNSLPQRADDLWVIRNGDTHLYCYGIGNGVAVTRSETFIGIRLENDAVSYCAPAEGMNSKEYQAPELHRIAGRWKIYIAFCML